uniref:uncharacterized protein n=1 Tax=Myxine glutinosa TaxID=7769 RepID=UPI00358F0B2E
MIYVLFHWRCVTTTCGHSNFSHVYSNCNLLLVLDERQEFLTTCISHRFDNSALPTLFRLKRIVSNARVLQSETEIEQIESVFTDEGGMEALMKLLTSVSSDGSSVPVERLPHMQLAVELMLNYSKSLKSKHCLLQNGVVKYLIKLLFEESCYKKELRQESRNLRKFGINLLANVSDEEEFKNALRNDGLVQLAVLYANVVDNPCKLSALEALCRTIDVDKMEVTCRNLDASYALIRTLWKRFNEGSFQLEKILYTKESIQKTMTVLSSECTRSNLQKGAIRVDQVIQNVQTELNENIDFGGKNKTKESPSFKPYELVFGDIAVSSGQKCTQLWPKAEDGLIYVPYEISSAFSDVERETIQQAVREFDAKTCVRLVQWTNEADFIFIQALGRTWSFLGRLGGAQTLSLSQLDAAHKAKVLHMLMHVLGFHHEHCRPDRDKYIRVNKDNIQNVYQNAFEKYENQQLDIPYDFKSIMHYSKTKFAKDEDKPVITPLTTTTIAHANCLSDLDIERIPRLYADVHKKRKWKILHPLDFLHQKRSPK